MFEDSLERLDLKCETHVENSQNMLVKCINVVSMPFFVLYSLKNENISMEYEKLLYFYFN